MRRTLLGFYFMAVVLLVLPMLSTTILAMEAVESGIGTSVSIVTTPFYYHRSGSRRPGPTGVGRGGDSARGSLSARRCCADRG
ncbi:MAG: hypothetical protein WKH64_00295 [Chloroflexia bacterium]